MVHVVLGTPTCARGTVAQTSLVLPQDQVNQMMTCLVDGMGADKPVDIQQVSAQGMVHALAFANENFSDAQARQRDQIMQCICSATQVPDIKVGGTAVRHSFMLQRFHSATHTHTRAACTADVL